MIIRRKTRAVSKKHVNKKLIFKLRRLAVFFMIVTSVIIFDIYKGFINPLLALAGIIAGVLIGSFLGKYSNIHWHEETGKVISRWNAITVIIIVTYLSFAFSKRWIFGHWIHGEALTAFSFSLACGVLTGRIVSIRKQIRGILRERGLLKASNH
jgi:hypothetical protein